jgi:RNase H-like domain found in reverse transcriptase/Reverse transcriptase (RNA-dependent DNA polymerase)
MCFIYLDDMLIASRTKEEHLLHLREVLGRLQENGLVLNVAKCVWGQAEVEFLGHSVSAAGVAPLPGRVAALQSFPQPTTVQQLQAFLGLFNFYRHFVPAAAAIVRPLTDALRGGRKGSAPVGWSPPMLQAFAAAKAALAAATLLDHPALGADISVVTDASSTHVGAVLQQRRSSGTWRPLGFFPGNCPPPSHTTAPSTASYWRSTAAYCIFALCLNAGGSRFSLTIKHW